ncbi:MAG: DNA topoisomerase [Elusimicrobia bacterium]|nr:DNA topoisomerase [Elusimicrobiota bacterium]
MFDLFSEQYRIHSTPFATRADIDAVIEAVRPAAFAVASVERKELRRRPAPPFTTSTLQQAASQRYGYPAEKTMRIAQGLYEAWTSATASPWASSPTCAPIRSRWRVKPRKRRAR